MEAETDPAGPDTGSSRVLRDGGWSYDAYVCRSAGRSYYHPSNSHNLIGFRVLCLP